LELAPLVPGNVSTEVGVCWRFLCVVIDVHYDVFVAILVCLYWISVLPFPWRLPNDSV